MRSVDRRVLSERPILVAARLITHAAANHCVNAQIGNDWVVLRREVRLPPEQARDATRVEGPTARRAISERSFLHNRISSPVIGETVARMLRSWQDAAGAVAYEPQPLEKPPRRNLLVCWSQPIVDVVIDL